MKWEKHGVIWQPDGSQWWARSHASCPTPYFRDDGTLRLFLQCRDEHNVGRIGFVDVDSDNPKHVLNVATEPVLDIGSPGAFDDNGVFQTSIVKAKDGTLLMYYVGFELCHNIRYRLLTGLAVSRDGGDSFQRLKSTPVLERSNKEMHFRGGPFVLSTSDGFEMWYVAGSEWEDIGGKSMPVYDIRYMTSKDGIHWPEEGQVVLPISKDDEHGFGRPYVRYEGDRYRMYYSIRKKEPCAYRMGYAESLDGINWQRMDDQLNLDVSTIGWDSESIEYSAVLKSGTKTWMFYNGNDFGATGFGLAELVEA